MRTTLRTRVLSTATAFGIVASLLVGALPAGAEEPATGGSSAGLGATPAAALLATEPGAAEPTAAEPESPAGAPVAAPETALETAPETAPDAAPLPAPAEAPAAEQPVLDPAPVAVADPDTMAAPAAVATSAKVVEVRWAERTPKAQWYTVYRYWAADGAEQSATTTVFAAAVTASGPVATIANLLPSTEYTFAISFTGDDYTESALSERGSPIATPALALPPAPAAPAALALSGKQVRVTWTAVAATPAVTAYTVAAYRADNPATAVSTSAKLAGTVTSYAVGGLELETAYVFSVTATNADGVGPASALSASTTTTGAQLPSAPEAPVATVDSSSQITVAWPAIDTSLLISSYTVTVFQGETQLPAAGTVDPLVGGTTYVAKGLLADTEYSFSVVANGADGAGPASARSTAVRTRTGAPGGTGPLVLSVDPDRIGYWVDAAWTAPAASGGYPVTGYLIEFHSAAATNNNNTMIARVELPGDATGYRLNDVNYAAGTVSARIWALSSAGQSSTAVQSNAVATIIRSTGAKAVRVAAAPVLSRPTDDSVTATWTAPTATVALPAPAGYLVRVTERRPNQFGSAANVLVKTVDAGLANPVGASRSTVITGLEGNGRYSAAVLGYDVVDGVRLYRQSSVNSATTAWSGAFANQTTGSRAPFIGYDGAIAAPVADSPVQLTFTGAAITDAASTGNSPVTSFRVDLYEAGVGKIGSQLVEVAEGAAPVATFTDLTRGGSFAVRYTATNAAGDSAQSIFSGSVTLPARYEPGSRPPAIASLAELKEAIRAGTVEEQSAKQAGIPATAEPGDELDASLIWDADADTGEVWIYEGPTYAATFASVDGNAIARIPTLGLDEGEYYAVLFGEDTTVRPVAVRFSVKISAIGPQPVTDAVFRWGMNNETNNGAYFGGCNFLAAGKSADSGSAKVFTPGQYAATGSGADGNVRVEKPNAAGEYSLATWATKCLDTTGATLKSGTATGYGENQVVIENGVGTVDPATGSATIQWTGSYTVAYYGGMTFWYVTDPRLVVVDGVGTITATAGGFASDMDDLSKWEALAPETITLTTLGSASDPMDVGSRGFNIRPDYCGVEVEASGGRSPQVRSGADSGARCWGSFPQDFIDFQVKTGQSAYWYSSGGAADDAKIAATVSVRYTTPLPGDDDGGIGGGDEEEEEVDVPRDVITAPVALAAPAAAPAAQQPRAVTPRVLGTASTSVDSMETLLALIEEKVITAVPASEAGVPSTFAIGDRLDFDFAWDGEDAGGVIWIYPEVLYAGTFVVTDGRVRVSIDSRALAEEGGKQFAFFGDAGTSVAIALTASGFAALPASLGDTRVIDGTADAPAPPVVTAAGGDTGGDQLPLVLLIVGLGVLLLGAAGAGTLLLRKPKAPVAAG